MHPDGFSGNRDLFQGSLLCLFAVDLQKELGALSGTMRVELKRVGGRGAPLELPAYATEGAAGMDLRADVELSLPPGERALVPTGIARDSGRARGAGPSAQRARAATRRHLPE